MKYILSSRKMDRVPAFLTLLMPACSNVVHVTFSTPLTSFIRIHFQKLLANYNTTCEVRVS